MTKTMRGFVVALALTGARIAFAGATTEVIKISPHMGYPGMPIAGYADVEVQLSIEGPHEFYNAEVRAGIDSDYQRCSMRKLGEGQATRFFRVTCAMPLYTFTTTPNVAGFKIYAQAVYDNPDGSGTMLEAAAGSLAIPLTTYARFYCYGTGDGSGNIPARRSSGYTTSGGLCCYGSWKKPRVGWVCK